jgi:hypothetical protein
VSTVANKKIDSVMLEGIAEALQEMDKLMANSGTAFDGMLKVHDLNGNATLVQTSWDEALGTHVLVF